MDMEIKLLIGGVILFFVARIMKRFRGVFVKPYANKIYNECYEWIETGWSAVLLAAFIMYLFIQAFKIPSGSMRNTLLEGDHLFVNKCVYGFRVPLSSGKRIWAYRKVQRGDIVVFRCPSAALSLEEKAKGINKDFIKRCVAEAGDIVEIKNKVVFVNGNRVMEPFVNFEDNFIFPAYKMNVSDQQYQSSWETGGFANLSPEFVRDNFGPVKVPEKCYFVMGDNRDRSFDSRFWGPLSDSNMKGRALILYWPLKRIKLIK